MRFLSVAILLLAVVQASPILADDTATTFESALAATKRNEATPAGERYDVDFGKHFGEHYVNSIERCASGVTGTDDGKFDMLFRVAADGKIEEALIRPATKIATCLLEEVRTGTFPNPPKASWWVRIEMSFTD